MIYVLLLLLYFVAFKDSMILYVKYAGRLEWLEIL
jgi:hypothetical protein